MISYYQNDTKGDIKWITTLVINTDNGVDSLFFTWTLWSMAISFEVVRGKTAYENIFFFVLDEKRFSQRIYILGSKQKTLRFFFFFFTFSLCYIVQSLNYHKNYLITSCVRLKVILSFVNQGKNKGHLFINTIKNSWKLEERWKSFEKHSWRYV